MDLDVPPTHPADDMDGPIAVIRTGAAIDRLLSTGAYGADSSDKRVLHVEGHALHHPGAGQIVYAAKAQRLTTELFHDRVRALQARVTGHADPADLPVHLVEHVGMLGQESLEEHQVSLADPRGVRQVA